jgi:hypothetical protein
MNGWTNYETWNVALWMGNDERLYNIASRCKDYAEYKEHMRACCSTGTSDGVSWWSDRLDTDELDELILEF